jgi:hypothetical protein
VKCFRCYIAGENFPGELVDDDVLVGFFVTRFVTAAKMQKLSDLASCAQKRACNYPRV